MVGHCSANAEAIGSNPFEVEIFFLRGGGGIYNNNNSNIFMQDCRFSFKKKTAINAGPVKN